MPPGFAFISFQAKNRISFCFSFIIWIFEKSRVKRLYSNCAPIVVLYVGSFFVRFLHAKSYRVFICFSNILFEKFLKSYCKAEVCSDFSLKKHEPLRYSGDFSNNRLKRKVFIREGALLTFAQSCFKTFPVVK